MSYEGYQQAICSNRHRFDFDAYTEGVCFCGAKAIWENGVDQTNGEDVGYIPDFEFIPFKIADDMLSTCQACGHSKIIEPAKYRLPTREERCAMQYWRPDGEGLTVLHIPTNE